MLDKISFHKHFNTAVISVQDRITSKVSYIQEYVVYLYYVAFFNQQ